MDILQLIKLLKIASKKDARIKNFIESNAYVDKIMNTDSVTELSSLNSQKIKNQVFDDAFTPQLAIFIKNEGGLSNFGDETRNLVNFLVPKLTQGNTVSSEPQGEDFLVCKNPLEKSSITFDDIAGQDEIKANITKNYIYPFTYPSLFKVKTKGILLYGPPGTGKTLLARAATAQIDGAAFFSPTPGELRGKYEGETEKNIDKVFGCAQKLLDEKDSKYRTAIIFIDEFDAMAAARSDDPGMRRSVNAFLQAMDGMIRRENVSVVAATNYPWDLDEAILRRFTSRIFVDLPDSDAVEWLIRDALIKNYALPYSSKKETSMYLSDGNWNNWVFDVIRKYGGEESCKQTRSSLFGSSTITTYFKPEDLEQIVKRLLPNPKAVEIKNKIKQQIYDPDTVPNDASFGYSASDITKIMNIAIQDSAFRAMNEMFEPVKINNVTYYVASLTGKLSIKQIPEQHRGMILNFTICLDDILDAIDKYPPTVLAKEYIKLLNYVSHGRPY